MTITVHMVGGVFGDDRMTRIQGRTLTVSNRGAVEAERGLRADTMAELTRLARVVAELDRSPSAEPEYVDDGGTTTIEITLPDISAQILLSAGDDAPTPVWDLLDAVDRAGRA